MKFIYEFMLKIYENYTPRDVPVLPNSVSLVCVFTLSPKLYNLSTVKTQGLKPINP